MEGTVGQQDQRPPFPIEVEVVGDDLERSEGKTRMVRAGQRRRAPRRSWVVQAREQVRGSRHQPIGPIALVAVPRPMRGLLQHSPLQLTQLDGTAP